jgi:hypothetical protein
MYITDTSDRAQIDFFHCNAITLEPLAANQEVINCTTQTRQTEVKDNVSKHRALVYIAFKDTNCYAIYIFLKRRGRGNGQ